MADHDPILLRRLLELRRFPLLGAADLGELAMLAENVAETSYESGAVIARPPVPGEIHLILSGRIDAGASVYAPQTAFGFLEVMARRPLAAPAIAVGETRTLRITGSDLREILEDNFGLLLIAVRELAARTLAVREAEPPPPPTRALRAGPLAAAPMATPLGLVERMIVLRRQPPFAPSASRGYWPDGLGRSAPLEPTAILADASKETTWPAGALMARCDEPARDAYFLLDGVVRVVRAEREPYVIGPGGSIGVIESLAGACHPATVEVVAPVRALEVASSVIFDAFEDHTELGLSVIEALAGGLLEAAAAVEARTS
jgi:CRP-like cAMP-binding protein